MDSITNDVEQPFSIVNKKKKKQPNSPPSELIATDIISNDFFMFGNLKLNTRWNLWFHHNPTDWTMNGYKIICCVDTIYNYFKIINNLHLVTSIKIIDLFFFRENIDPTWEHPANANGGCWSIKSSIDLGFDIWRDICTIAVAENILKHVNDSNLNGCITGITITNKLMNNIIKIWVSDRKVNDEQFINKEIFNIINSKIIFQVFMPESI